MTTYSIDCFFSFLFYYNNNNNDNTNRNTNLCSPFKLHNEKKSSTYSAVHKFIQTLLYLVLTTYFRPGLREYHGMNRYRSCSFSGSKPFSTIKSIQSKSCVNASQPYYTREKNCRKKFLTINIWLSSR